MDSNYMQGKPIMIDSAWEIMEEMQEAYPYCHWGWNGFVLMRYEWS